MGTAEKAMDTVVVLIFIIRVLGSNVILAFLTSIVATPLLLIFVLYFIVVMSCIV